MTSEQTTPRELRLCASGTWFMGIGGAATVCLWSVNAAEPIPYVIYSPAVTTTIMAFLSGVFLATQLAVARALARQLADAVRPIAFQVETNTVTIGRLEAARTIDQHNLRQAEAQLRDAIQLAKAEAVKEIRERLDGVDEKLSVTEELRERFTDLEADLASFRVWQKRSEPALANGKALRSVPKQPG